MSDIDRKQISAEALAGPWQAVLADRFGEVMTIDEFDEWQVDPDDVKVVIVRGTAVPTDRHDTGELRLPGSWRSDDRLVEFDDFEEPEEVEARWAQAQAMAAGLNAAGASS